MPEFLRIVHAIPEHDEIEHQLHMRCPCGPQHDPEIPHLIVHTALDGRVAVEQAQKLLGITEPYKMWANYIITFPR